MKATKREKITLAILSAILIVILYKQFIFTPLSETLAEKRIIRDEVEEEYNKAMDAVNNLKANKEDLKILKANIVNKSADFYPCLLQEKIILELDKLIKESGLEGNITFSPIEVSAVDKLESSFKEAVEDNFNSAVEKFKEVNNYNGQGEITSLQEKPNDMNSSDEQNSISDDEEQEDSSNSTGYATVEQMKLAINFDGTYEALSYFISSVNNYERNVCITDINISASSDSEVSGVMNLEFYAVPKIDQEDIDNYLKWDLNNVYGKESPFSAAAATGAFASTIEQLVEKEHVNDFVMMVKSSASELPTLTMGTADDATRETYIYSDKDKIEEVKIEFSEDKGKLYYKYNTEDSIYPKNKAAIEFTTVSDDIVVEITSEARLNKDSSGIKLKVVNNTSKKVKIIIKNDDKKEPRVSVTSEGGTVNVTKN